MDKNQYLYVLMDEEEGKEFQKRYDVYRVKNMENIYAQMVDQKEEHENEMNELMMKMKSQYEE